MSQSSPPSAPPPEPAPPGSREERRTAWAAGGTVFAGLMLLIGGVLAVLEGIVGIAHDSVYRPTRGAYVYRFDVTAWGWIHLVLGVVAALVGYELLRGAEWARRAGIFIAGLDLIANFMFLPYQPVWAVVMVAIDAFVIWALATYHPARPGGPL
jgi:hypothetical protein